MNLRDKVSASGIDYQVMVSDLAKNGDAIIKGMDALSAHVLHMAVGIMGEVVELFTESQTRDDACEELGDIEFFFTGLCQSINIVIPHSPKTRVFAYEHAKLYNAAGAILDCAKRIAIYNDQTKYEKLPDLLMTFREELSLVYALHHVTQQDAIDGNIWKLALKPNARYKGGKYSDSAAQVRADKQPESKPLVHSSTSG